ncbi:MAG: leucine-rich repeat domain-containing protein [Alphaproteobacteria bacterium]|nr:leucine-rich repeat domain-containing protein [Alphaproteobacteria bacterium]
MKIKFSFLLLAALTNILSMTYYTYAVDNLESIDVQNELTIEQKKEIIENLKNEFAKNAVILNDRITNEILNEATFSTDHYRNFSLLPLKKQQEITNQTFRLNWLTNLNLNYNYLTSLPRTIDNLINLKVLSLRYNKIKSLPKTIGKLIHLEALLVKGNKLRSLPRTINKLINLSELFLCENKFTSFPETICNLTNLQGLGFSQNKLTSLPETISNLTNLQTLRLGYNNLTSLPETIGNLIELKELDLYNNHLTSLPKTIGYLTNLKQLNLSSNQLTMIPASIKNIPNLILLNLQNNPNLLPRSDNPLEWGKEELQAHFGDRVLFDEPDLEVMPISTTKGNVYATLNKQSLRINRDIFVINKLPDIHVEKIFEGEEMLQALIQIITSINFKDNTQPGYLSYEMLANDFASDARNDNLSNLDKVWAHLMPRLTGYIRTLYNLPLEGNDVQPWKMYEAQIPETQKALTFIMERIRDVNDSDAKMLLFNLLVNGLLHCPTGQSEGINAVAYALSEGDYQTNNFKDNLKRLLAVKKNANFTTAILAKGADNSQNVHLISKYRDKLKEDLGLNAAISSYQERMGIMGQDPFNENKWNVVKVFYDIATPNRLIDWVMQSAETKKDREDEKNLRDIAGQKLSPTEHSKAVNPLRTQTRQNKQFRPFTTGSIAEYLHSQGLITDDENDHRWQHYFTADPVMDDFAILTRDGAKAILIHEGFLIEDPKNKQIISNKDIITD